MYDEIHTLEMVWDTEIKIDPCNFSEGQMRRLDIMRNILKNSQILIFDEATANIDLSIIACVIKGENYYFFYAQSGRIARSRYYCGFGEATYKAGE